MLLMSSSETLVGRSGMSKTGEWGREARRSKKKSSPTAPLSLVLQSGDEPVLFGQFSNIWL